MKKADLEPIRKGNRPRFHSLAEATVGEGEGLPELFIDFRKAFAIPTLSLYGAIGAGAVQRVAVVQPVYLYDLIHRYHSYHSRVGLPD